MESTQGRPCTALVEACLGQGKTPADVAEEKGHTELAILLRSGGACDLARPLAATQTDALSEC